MGRTAALAGAASLLLCACGGLHGGPAVDTSALRPSVTPLVCPSLDAEIVTPPPDGCPTPTPGPTETPQPTDTPTPAATPTPTAAPTPAATHASVPTQLIFSGALSGAMQNPTVICEQNIPQGNQGFMSVTGTVGGTQQVFTIWSTARTTPNEVYEGTQAGVIDYGPVYGANPGIGDFDWSRGATVKIYLAPGPDLASSPQPSPTPYPSAAASASASPTATPSPSAPPTPAQGIEVDGTISCP